MHLSRLCLLLVVCIVPRAIQAQPYQSVTAGIVVPTSILADQVERGLQARVAVGLSAAFVGLQIEAGAARFPALAPDDPEIGADLERFHVGLGARLEMAMFRVGADGIYAFGEGDDGFGLVPELGVGLGRLEVMLDHRLDGDWRWWGLRVGIGF